MKMAKEKNKFLKHLECVKGMPPLHHSVPDSEFDIRKSEVVMWLVREPEVLQWLFNSVMNKKAIVYDPESGTWKGAEWSD